MSISINEALDAAREFTNKNTTPSAEMRAAWVLYLNSVEDLTADRDSWENQADQRVSDALHFLARAEAAEIENRSLIKILKQTVAALDSVSDELAEHCGLSEDVLMASAKAHATLGKKLFDK